METLPGDPGKSGPNGRKWSHTSNVSVLRQSVLEDIETVSFWSGPCQDVKGMGQLEKPSVVPTPLPSGESVALDWAQEKEVGPWYILVASTSSSQRQEKNGISATKSPCLGQFNT